MSDLAATHDYLADWVKKDPDTVENILTVALSATTGQPLNLMLRAKTSVGKSWPISKVLGLFPNATILSGATPKNFFYANGERVDENGAPITAQLEEIEQRLASFGLANQLRAADNLEKAKLAQERKNLLSNSRILLDFRGRIFGVLDSVAQELWDTLKAALSHDSFEMEYRTVVEGRQRVVLIRGWPTIIYATAANEERRQGWEQIRSRFVIITPSSDTEKFRAANELTSDLYGLPAPALQALYPQKKLENARAEILLAMELIKELRSNVGASDSDPTANIIFNPYRRWLNQLFPHLAGEDMRNYRYLHAYINVSALMNAADRFALTVDGQDVAVVAAWADVERAVSLIGKDLTPMTADKAAFYRRYVEPMWAQRVEKNRAEQQQTLAEQLTPAFTVADVVEYAQGLGQPLSRKSVRETYLELFVDVGLLREDNPDRKQNEAVEYKPNVTPERLAGYLAGFTIPQRPESSVVKEAISELGRILGTKQVGWQFDGQTVDIDAGGPWCALLAHDGFEPDFANALQIIADSPIRQQPEAQPK